MLFVLLHVAGVISTTLLLTWGLFAFAFIVIGGFSFDGLMHQLANLASRYVAATPDRLASFRMTVLAAHLLLSSAVLIVRRHALLPKLEDRHG
ncbi:hypothetical protein ACFFNU_19015 [Sphingomonas yabuuchiae]|jgi:hypothetical protein|nr:hypothetical protein [Sphingomonas sp. ABOLF]|tara:strand:+ start:3468 stop:3746 length:279 start_codon:yes stop_codon:yes gene_type:complete